MELEDLRILEIGLELYRRENALQEECEPLIAVLLEVVRHDISLARSRAFPPSPRRRRGSSLKPKFTE